MKHDRSEESPEARAARHVAHGRMLAEHRNRKQWREDDKRRRALYGRRRRGCLTALVH